MSSTAAATAASSYPSGRAQNTVLRIRIGGSAGLRMMIALPWAAPPTSSRERAVVRVNSSMFWRVPGPAEREATVETISAYGTGLAEATAATIGAGAWPPQVIRFMLGASRCSVRLTVGTTGGPSRAGVRSMAVMPAAASRGALAACTRALVASKARSISPPWTSTQSIPEAVASTPSSRARARPSEAGSMPTRARSSSEGERSSLAIRSVPMLPDPMTTQDSVMVRSPRSGDDQADRAQPVELGPEHVPGGQRDGGVQGPGHDHVPGLEGRAERVQGVGQPGDRVQRVAEGGRAGAGGDQLAVAGHGHPGQPRVDPVKGDQAARQGDGGTGGEVGDRVGQPDAPVRDPRVDDLDRRHRPGGGPAHVKGGAVRAGQGGLEHDGDLGFDLGLDQPVKVDLDPVGMDPGGQHRAVVGLVDAELGLHGPAGQAELVADDVALAVGLEQLDQAALDGVGLGGGHLRPLLGQRRHRDPLAAGPEQRPGQLVDGQGGLDPARPPVDRTPARAGRAHEAPRTRGRQPSWSEMASAAWTTEARKNRRRVSPLTRITGPATLTAAMTSPRALRRGAATLATPSSLSPMFSAHPWARTRSSSARSCAGSHTVASVLRSGRHPASSAARRRSGRWASRTLPVLVQWAELRCPTRPKILSMCGLSRRST